MKKVKCDGKEYPVTIHLQDYMGEPNNDWVLVEVHEQDIDFQYLDTYFGSYLKEIWRDDDTLENIDDGKAYTWLPCDNNVRYAGRAKVFPDCKLGRKFYGID